jgi:hypothetical protein
VNVSDLFLRSFYLFEVLEKTQKSLAIVHFHLRKIRARYFQIAGQMLH